MVAPEYAATRSTLAKKSGFGQTAKQKSGRTSKAVVKTAAS
jgi:predicted transcriptional regulator